MYIECDKKPTIMFPRPDTVYKVLMPCTRITPRRSLPKTTAMYVMQVSEMPAREREDLISKSSSFGHDWPVATLGDDGHRANGLIEMCVGPFTVDIVYVRVLEMVKLDVIRWDDETRKTP